MASPEEEVAEDGGLHGFGGTSPNPYLEQLLQGMASSAAAQQHTDTAYNPWYTQLPYFSSWASNIHQPTTPEYNNQHSPDFDLLNHLTNCSSLNPEATGSADPPLSTHVPGHHQPPEHFQRPGSLGSAFDSNVASNLLGSPSGAFGEFPRDVDRGRASAESGRDLYTDALNQWASYQGPTYNPFGTADVFQTAEDIVGRQTPSPPPQPSAPSHSKPSYCDVAKNHSGREEKVPSASSSKEPTRVIEAAKLAELSASGTASVPCRKSRSSSRSHKSKDAADAPTVLPDSKYGLDDFEDPASVLKERVRRQHSSGSDSVPASRKGSTSSVGSGSSGLEEILSHRGTTSPADSKLFSVYDEDGTSATQSASVKSSPAMPTKMQKGQRHQAHKGKSNSQLGGSETTSATGKEKKPNKEKTNTKPFFDPKRIFQPEKGQSDPIPNNQQRVPDPKVTGKNSRAEPFFDPKRMFSKGKGAASVPNNQHHSTHTNKDASMLNNGKVGSSYPCGAPGKPTSTHYIVNDLRHTKKHTNTDGKAPPMTSDKACNTATENSPQYPDSSESKTGAPPAAAERTSVPKRRKNENLPRKAETRQAKKSRKAKEDQADPIGDFLSKAGVWFHWTGEQLGLLIWNVTMLILKCAALLVVVLVGYAIDMSCSAWAYVRLHVFRFGKGHSNEDDSEPGANKRLKPQGLKENIVLPTTGDEAMRRLLACKGKDPYSILGVRMDVSDEELKKYYRKQAVLVHPDKNQQAGAEEAFKILGHAFELIGEPEKRQRYDAQRCEASEAEAAMQEFVDLLSKLQEKIQEEANTMRCYTCGGKHRRVLKDRPSYIARYCDRCNTWHAAKEGDVWAETTMLGFLWHYFACMEGKIYDITEWASCQSNHFKHIQANSHQVIYRIATNGSRQRHQQREPDLEDFLSHLFHHPPDSTSPHGPPNPDSFSFPRSQTSTSGMSSNSWNSSSQNTRKKRKKRKH